MLYVCRTSVAYRSNVNYLVPVLEVRTPPPPPPRKILATGLLDTCAIFI